MTFIWYMARCHSCDLAMPFRSPIDREEWVRAHQSACGNAVDMWGEYA